MLHSIGAVFAGLIFIFITHTGMDALLGMFGVLPPPGQPILDDSLLLLISAYRGVFSVIGCYIVARLAPHHPMRHALILGGIGTVLSAVGSYVMRDMGPAWYGIGLIAMSLPYAWLGAYLFERKRP
ncbi:MAG: hypothetical protein IT488_02745 [Gammaproteobacteria bacterium]|nr:hypothetical protein [Gammaproteobacteria bacterium]